MFSQFSRYQWWCSCYHHSMSYSSQLWEFSLLSKNHLSHVVGSHWDALWDWIWDSLPTPQQFPSWKSPLLCHYHCYHCPTWWFVPQIRHTLRLKELYCCLGRFFRMRRIHSTAADQIDVVDLLEELLSQERVWPEMSSNRHGVGEIRGRIWKNKKSGVLSSS